MDEQKIQFLEKFTKKQQKELRQMARKLCDDSKKFYDSIEPLGCAYCDIVELVAAIASDMTFED